MKKIISIVLILILSISFSGCKNKNDPSSQIIKCSLDYEPSTLDPQIAEGAPANTIVTNIFEGLTKIDENNSAIPGVAYKWEANSDFTEYTFYLRENATWSDENKTLVTAKDFIFALSRAVDPATASSNAKLLYCIKNAKDINLRSMPLSSLGVKEINDHTLSITLESENKDLPLILAQPIAMPCNKAFFESCNGQYGLENKNLISNGPFKIKSRYGWDHYNAIHLVKNQDYIGDDPPSFAGVSFLMNQSSDSTVDLIKNETIDIGRLSSLQIEEAHKNKMQISEFNSSIYGITFNCSNEIFSNVNIRKAFLTALNKDYLLSSLDNKLEKVTDIIPDSYKINGEVYRDLAGRNLYLHESENSKALLEKGLSELKLKTLPEVTITCKDESDLKPIVNNMIEMLNNKLGYYFNMEPVSKSTLAQKVKGSSYQIAIAPIAFGNNSIYENLNTFRSDNKNNIANYQNEHFDNLLNAAENIKSSKAINSLIETEKHLNDNAIFYPLYMEKSYFACAKNVSGVIFYPYNLGIYFASAKKVK